MTLEATAFLSLTFLGGCWVLLFWFYRDYRVDAFRQGMFALRNRFFDEAADGTHIAFSDPAYGFLRRTMNGFIRSGRRLSLLHILVFSGVGTFSRAKHEAALRAFESEWRSALEALSPEGRDLVERYKTEMHQLFLNHMVLSSPVLVAMVVPPLVSWFVARHWFGKVVQWLRKPLTEIDAAALACGA